MYTLSEGLDVQAKFATIIRSLDDLEAKKVQEVQIVNEWIAQPCLICTILSHSTCSAKYVFRTSLRNIQTIF